MPSAIFPPPVPPSPATSPDEPAPRPPREMTPHLAAYILHERNLWTRRRGRWKDKPITDLPFTTEEHALALNYAVQHLRAYPLPHQK